MTKPKTRKDQNNIIDMSLYESRVYMGRDTGYRSKDHFELEKREVEGNHPIVVYFPDDTVSVLSSFFLGMFGERIIEIGNQDAFLRVYKFIAPDHVIESINDYINCAILAKES